MRIVILDGYCVNPGDLSWGAFDALGSCTVYDHTPAADTVERCRGAQALLTNKVILSGEIMAQLPELRYIGLLSTGYNVVDVEAARARGVVVANIPAYSTRSVTELVFALLLEIARGVGHHAARVREGVWMRGRDFSFVETPQIELAGRTMGVVGLGRIGGAVAELARSFGMQVLAHTSKAGPDLPQGVEAVSLDELCRRSDVLTLHCPLTDATRGLIGARELALMKPTAILINTARGPLVDEAALAGALNTGRLYAAGLDVLSVEPPTERNPLPDAPNACITPHIGWATLEARTRLIATAAANLRAFLAGEPVNRV